MTEWHIPPEYIFNNWTDEELNLMIEKLVERKERERVHVLRDQTPANFVPDSVLFLRAGNMIKHIRNN